MLLMGSVIFNPITNVTLRHFVPEPNSAGARRFDERVKTPAGGDVAEFADQQSTASCRD